MGNRFTEDQKHMMQIEALRDIARGLKKQNEELTNIRETLDLLLFSQCGIKAHDKVVGTQLEMKL